MAEISQEDFEKLQSELNQQEAEKTTDGIIKNDPEASGRYDAFLSGMTNNEEYKTRWLAEKRFPGLVELGLDPMQFYFVDGDGDISYKDPNDGFKAKKEFKEGFFGTDVDYLDNIGPTGQFLAEVIGGVGGMGAGFTAGGLPGAIAGGSAGTAAGGSAAYSARAGISAALGGPSVEVGKAAKDLSLSSAFGGLPIGVPGRAIPKAFRGIYEKFPGVEGREALQDIVINGGKNVDQRIAYMEQKYPGVVVTRAEAEIFDTQGTAIQAWLRQQPRNEKLMNMYNQRNTRINQIAEDFFDEILTGKYVDDSLKNKLTGKAAADADVDVATALDAYIKKQKVLLQERTAPMYKDAYDLDVAIDVSDVLAGVRKVIADPNASGKKIQIYKKVEKALVDGRTKNKDARNTTELLHAGLRDDFNRIFSELSGGQADGPLKQEITTIRNTVSNRLKEANPTYKDVTQIYDEALGTAQILDRSIAGQFAKVVDLGGTKAATLSKRLFSGNIKPDEVLELKRILQETDEGATAWQNLKGTWLATQWDEVIAGQKNPLGEPNAYLRALGIKTPSNAFPAQQIRYSPSGAPLPASADEMAKLSQEVAEAQVRGKKAKMWQSILEPEELGAFMDLTDILQIVGKVQTRGGSDTFTKFAIDDIITSGSKVVLGSQTPGQAVIGKGGAIIDTITSIPATVFKGSDVASLTAQNQKDAYIDMLIAHVVDPKKRLTVQNGLEQFKPGVYLLSQTFARGGIEGVTGLADTIREQNERVEQEVEAPTSGPLEQNPNQPNREDILNQINTLSPNTFTPIIGSTDKPELSLPQMTSPSILPNEKDREIAMRQQSGIAGLV